MVAFLKDWNELVQAIDCEIAEAQKHSRTYDLQDGLLIATDPAGWLYRFFFEHDIPLPEGTEGNIELSKNKSVHCAVVSYVPPHLFLLIDTFVGESVGDVKFCPEPWRVLQALRKWITEELMFQNIQPSLPMPGSMSNSVVANFGCLGQGYNDSQKQAAAVVVHGRNTAVWGPPGTGKTRTLALAVAHLIQSGQRVLLVAPSNAAVDQAVYELVSLLESHRLTDLAKTVLRYGFPVQPAVRDHNVVSPKAWLKRLAPPLYDKWESLESRLSRLVAKNAPDVELQSVLGSLAQVRREARDLLAKSLNLPSCLATTVAMMVTDASVRQAGDFNLLAVDEASMVSLAFLVVSHRLAARLTLFGDFRQLPPVTASDGWRVRKWFGKTGFDAWSIPDVVNQGRLPPFVKMLQVQYRMHPELRQLVSNFAYQGNLVDDPAVATKRGTEAIKGPFPNCAVVAVDVYPFGAEACRPSEGSRWNVASAIVALNIAIATLAEGHRETAVITPYSAQARLLHRMVKELGKADSIRVGTVHRFQGSEAPFVILDLVEAHRSRRPWQPFFEDDSENTATRLCTVALSRAQLRAVLLADWTLLGSADGPSPGSPFRRLASMLSFYGRAKTSDIPIQSNISDKILVLEPMSGAPEDLKNLVKEAKSQVILHWPSKEPLKRLPEDLYQITQALHIFKDRRLAGQILLSPGELRLGIPGALTPQTLTNVHNELPSSPVIVVDDNSWWIKTLRGYWFALMGMPRTVKLLLELCGWGISAIRTTTQFIGGDKKDVTWSTKLICPRCNKATTVEWQGERPITVCYSCGRKARATADQVEDFLSLLGEKCDYGYLYRVKTPFPPSWFAVCSGPCACRTSIRMLLQ